MSNFVKMNSLDKGDKLNKSNSSVDTNCSSFYLIKKKSVNFYPLVDIHFIQSFKIYNKYAVFDYEKKYEQKRRVITNKLNDDYYGDNDSKSACCMCNII